MNKLCDTTHKRCFSSKEEARGGMKNFSARLRIYKCPFCKMWHLTKITQLPIAYTVEQPHKKTYSKKIKKAKTHGRRIKLSADGTITYLD